MSEARVVSMRELNQRTSAVIDEINDKNQPAVITKHGRFVAVITPLGRREIESVVLAGDDQIREMIEGEEHREENGQTSGMSLDQAEVWLR